jgi:1-acyl-sn-glycerol-3-phosphate acyltransferase
MTELDLNPEPALKRWGRRAISITVVLLMIALYLAALPLTLTLAVVADIVRQRGWILVRSLFAVGWYLLCYGGGLLGLGATWLCSGVWAGASQERFVRWTQGIAMLWARGLYEGSSRIFGARTEVEGDERLGDEGPILLFIRHVSVGDVVIPLKFVSASHGMNLNHVLKSELMLDPCIDIAGHRWRNVYINRRSRNSRKEIELTGLTAERLGKKEGVVIWPEGTRFTPSKREKVLESLARKNPELYREASTLKNVLPPRTGGPLALLEHNERADAVFCAHTGLDATQHIRSFFNGSLLGATVRIKFWRVPFPEIPEGREARVKWLYHWWRVVDAWIGEAKG